MYEMTCWWDDSPAPKPVGVIPVDIIKQMIDYIDQGGLVDNMESFETRESVRERLILELEIRALEGRL
jgi:hypothetical protein